MVLKHYKLRFFKLRMVLIVIVLLLMTIQLVELPRLIASNLPPPGISFEDYDDLKAGSEVSGYLRNIIGSLASIEGETLTDDVYQGDISTNNYLVVTPKNKILLFRTVLGSECDRQVNEVYEGKKEAIRYRGKVREIPVNYRGSFLLRIISENLIPTGDRDGDVLTGTEIDITLYGDDIDEKYIIFTAAGAVIMLLIAVWLSLKPLNNLIYNIMVQKGKIEPELKLTKESISLGGAEPYQSEYEMGADSYDNNQMSGAETAEESTAQASRTAAPDSGFFYTEGADENGSFYVNADEGDKTKRHPNDRLNY